MKLAMPNRNAARHHFRRHWRARFPFYRAVGDLAPGSAAYQHGLCPRGSALVEDVRNHFEEGVVCKLSGDLETARQAFESLLSEAEVASIVRGECHYQLGELLQFEDCHGRAWIEHCVAALTFCENHLGAVSALRALRPSEVSASATDVPRILLVLGSNAATVAFANSILDTQPVVGVLQQYAEFAVLSRSFTPAAGENPLGLNGADTQHFSDESILGNRWNAIYMDDAVPHRYIGRGEANRPEMLSWLRSLDLDLIVSHGPERLWPEFISTARFGGINVHWGLSPTYRGMDTSRWPLVQHRPEWIGVTIHKLDAGLDTGPILYQARPTLRPGSTFRQIEYSLTNLACEIVPRAMREVLSDRARPVEQDLRRGTHYWASQWDSRYEAMLTPEYIGAEIDAYERQREERDSHVELINAWCRE